MSTQLGTRTVLARHLPRRAYLSLVRHASDIPKRVALRGEGILTSPRFNKGTAFTEREREDFGLVGRLPYRVNTLEEQCERAYAQLSSRDHPLRKNTFLQSMKDQNWVLYYALLKKHLKETVPIVYTPTQADAIANYSNLFRRSEGLYLSYPDKDTMEEAFLRQITGREVDLVVVTDSEAILGIGDQGVGGIAISAAKSVIYTLIGKVDPSRTLAVALDVGTNNENLLHDPLYVGWQKPRIQGQEYDDFVDKFVQLVRKHLPHSLLHFEDFGVANAHRLLRRYRSVHSVFNDDIQGTGAVTLAGAMSAVGVTGSSLHEQRIVIYGAGTAGLGIATQLRDAMVAIDGASVEDATRRFYCIDRPGLLTDDLPAGLMRDDQHEWARPAAEWAGERNGKDRIDLIDVVRKIKPTMLVGTSTHAGAFTEEVVRTMASNVERPIIFSLSNPSRLVEVHPHDANAWTEGRALLATGSPFPPAKMPSGRDYPIAECNNALIYPGLGFGAVLSRSREVTDNMIIAGARRLAALSPALKDPDNSLLPDLQDAPDVNLEIAVAVAEQAIEDGTAGVSWAKEEVRDRAKEKIWEPVYQEYVFDENGDR
ncbi:uncharacterized protein SCHCODRAFT_02484732 [Schizophyllum commune H4-8]|uniref:Malic enzyme n=1 Tax=Schizophyllum commune (strain H4-8 / FGSC 9210) TaxID=578458 RepID=D8PU59_SCHCM|nr:uncharacterized protein SCHCODRAFT_02484732 [Schizophyllum commune H4-8]KAI5899139.1 hypothetical protein SCHCODRAFT_02484732 [Schizophyllum commune H4-8]